MPRENKMGVMPVGRLLIQMSLPMMISMLVQALYNVVDSIFVARLSEKALTAVSIAFPIQSLMIAFATGTGVGINALLSMRLGEKKYDDVNKTAGNGIFLAIATYILYASVSIASARVYFVAQTSDQEIIDYGIRYLVICVAGSIFPLLGITFDRLLQATGRTFYAMISQLTGAITNIVFDPLLIFGLCGFPKMGIAGAAAATVLGQILGLIVSVIFNLKKNEDISFNIKFLRPRSRIITGIYKVGIPSIIMASIGSLMVFFLNRILGRFSSTAIAVFGVYFKLQSFVFMPIFGLNNGIVPIIAFNFGARKKSRILGTMKFGGLAAVLLMSLGTLIFALFPDFLLGLFNASDEMLHIGRSALRIISLHFPIAAICILLTSVFQALGHGVYSMLNSIIRQIVVLVPAAWLLSLTGYVNNVWWSFPIAEVSALIVTVIFFIKVYNKELAAL